MFRRLFGNYSWKGYRAYLWAWFRLYILIFAAILAAIIVADVLLPDFNILNTVDNSIKAVPGIRDNEP
ncbi:hypothetical protein AW736_26435 [Termitidicoccus mucosus]|uniref:Uncharacterized protein n=1 Tax=Termitidicoccus mucosus TaxID=1184151 RepID=A0A178IQ90_9BACT|nr:hypothetical protein AW736_26435 [Opitutaceae bacterium TSB47]